MQAKKLRQTIDCQEIKSSRPTTPIGPDGQKMSFEAAKQRNKVLEHSYRYVILSSTFVIVSHMELSSIFKYMTPLCRALIEKYDKLKRAYENGESYDEVDSFFEDELQVV